MNRTTALSALALSALALAATVSPAGPAGAAPGDLDATFGTGGTAVVDLGTYDDVQAMTVQPDGKIVAVGTTNSGPSVDGFAFRLNTDGSKDTAFGIRTLTVPGTSSEYVAAVAVQDDGKILVAGRTSNNEDAAVWRLTSTGDPDPDFGGGDGLVLADEGGYEYFSDVAAAPGGAVVAVGHTSTQGGRASVYRFTPAGLPDDSFDTDGKIAIGEAGSRAEGVAVQPDGKVLVTGLFGSAYPYGQAVRRLEADGDPDDEFGEGDGEAAAYGLSGWGFDVALQPDGRILVAGLGFTTGSTDGTLVRYTAAGRVDRTFGSSDTHDGVAVGTGAETGFYAVAALPDGSVVAGGYRRVDALTYSAAVAKVGPDGSADHQFGTGGHVVLRGTHSATDVAVQPDGKVLASGMTGSQTRDAVVHRLLVQRTTGPDAAPTCHGKPATVVGTPGKDRLRGTRRADVVVALGGNDVVKGLGGNDLVCAGDGADKVVGGPGKDRLYGERGRDRLVGGTGKDKLVGGPDRDSTSQRS